jgi:hypothetical protein
VRSLRLLAIIMVIGLFYGASPLVGRLVTTASASSAPMTSRPAAVNAPAADNDNLSAECDSGNPRKDKKCHYDSANTGDDNDNSGADVGGTSNQQPTGGLTVSSATPSNNQTISFTVNAAGDRLDQISWWVTGFNANDNDNDSSITNNETHSADCGGRSTCSYTNSIPTGDPGVLTVHAVARDRDGRQSPEMIANVYVQG